ncbi:MAG: CRTAC1 family protein [candidate division Zixibacteria bacterium]|nr:CRTAC1 family protein [candidate division Zixibacteria bacterium]MDH3936403.1 CRTAC1 family protein [candidate division Zixibacteria bacterium]MDH4032176.1 CRTAC1 family protein [candidate division Zixibacteria bacterium]
MTRRKRQVYIYSAVTIGLTALAVYLVMSRTRGPASGKQSVQGVTQALLRHLPENCPTVQFTDVSDSSGVVFRHFDAVRSTMLPEDMGSGAAWSDYDNDGDLDLYVVNLAGPITWSPARIAESRGNALYANNGDGSFTNVAKAAGVDHKGRDMGAFWGDYDGDGDLDLYVTSYGPNVLYSNNGDGSFSDVTSEARVGDNSFSTGAAWGDYDLDGYLDLYVSNYVEFRPEDTSVKESSMQYQATVPFTLNPSSYTAQANRLYHNLGNGSFEEVAEAAGVDNLTGRSLSVTWCDFNDDRRPDLYIANDVSANGMFQNVGNGTFADIGASSWAADYRGAMGLAIGDFDLDLDLDIFLTHWIAQENGLYSNMRTEFEDMDADSLRFRDIADGVGLGEIALNKVGWGTDFFDYDNDGLLDLLVINGSTFENPENTRELIPMKSMLFWNRANKGYFNVAQVAGESLNRKIVGRGAAFADYDDDGDVDVYVVVHGGVGMLLRNDGGNDNHWLKVQTIGRAPNTRAIGAKLRLVSGGVSQLREIGAGSSYISQNSLEAEFGLGTSTLIDSLVVTWPSGLTQVMTRLDADQTVVVTEGSH